MAWFTAVPIQPRRVTYAELIGGRYFDDNGEMERQAQHWPARRGQGAAQDADGFQVIGKSPPRRDLPGKVFGTLEMVNDVRLPGMLHAPHDPADGGRRRAGQGRRSFDQGYSGRPGRPDQGSARGRRREGMERGQGRAERSR